MAFALPIPRLHLFEIDDQPWFPQLLREKVQACLTLCWKLQVPIIQPTSPANLVATTLQRLLGSTLPIYTFVDFCAGAGGPTPSIERSVNEALRLHEHEEAPTNGISTSLPESTWMSKSKKPSRNTPNKSSQNGDATPPPPAGIDFILTDLFPNTPAWTLAASRSRHIHYIRTPINAAAAPPDLLSLAGFPTYGTSSTPSDHKSSSRRIFRLYNLAFHHFPDPLAAAILENTLSTANGFAIFELQGRDLGNLLTVLCLGPLMWMGSWWWFWGDWWHLFFTYVVPVVPFVLVFDGVVSCLRTRTEGEVKGLIRKVVEGKEREEPGKGGELLEGWRFEAGGEWHTYTGGSMRFFVGFRDGR